MERLTPHQRAALVEVGEPGEGPVPDAIFEDFTARGWGYFGLDGFWYVTPAGKRALELDELAARGAGGD